MPIFDGKEPEADAISLAMFVDSLRACSDPTKRRAADVIERLLNSFSETVNDAARYRWLRSEDTATNPLYYPFWQEFSAKLCREADMDALIDSAMTSRTIANEGAT